ncbi:uncharacterized protein ANIA_11542 [Aspergillus nidulans FGSC A4]|uniref:Uncharacterized protein n=1 Tax=Emericella nidulans (strain FGSC A4 / ATCC 38163 / CBS 112.46 / NRRL 194 / M139) TaxID=227321 RepID=C8VC69_EMENI|nr:hypothetical protein [Aspergillus nidulans FGSC A4]CBF79231.1 TPA: hypothetical protein ANIA_11542 [Aspergillus nidulans FGSC A4]
MVEVEEWRGVMELDGGRPAEPKFYLGESSLSFSQKHMCELGDLDALAPERYIVPKSIKAVSRNNR